MVCYISKLSKNLSIFERLKNKEFSKFQSLGKISGIEHINLSISERLTFSDFIKFSIFERLTIQIYPVGFFRY